MGSRMTRACIRVFVLIATMFIGTATAGAATLEQHVQAQATPLESLGAPVGLAAVGLGITGMLAGAFRRKKATVQPENERKF
ncbi:hypothetical protein DFQ14_11935 [Halopolyspora algeriensis]|uniref:Secreted protein with PEP-CTERM sorting signal n=1 Tax=Halopolyspora algeriensis TaxID=1500506 RepID=A0A368VIJ8_9ACTN|nr:hypothetical protein [Halopolyspora algeriensis]RCW38831.1 hypothetical protein DFQ14_11935 [Halopolyspora algeriensis]TQM46658.1 hypothetical protein FHU43_3776 [Halopolyspora algeriensis]